jgi:hypothetical protein
MSELIKQIIREKLLFFRPMFYMPPLQLLFLLSIDTSSPLHPETPNHPLYLLLASI